MSKVKIKIDLKPSWAGELIKSNLPVAIKYSWAVEVSMSFKNTGPQTWAKPTLYLNDEKLVKSKEEVVSEGIVKFNFVLPELSEGVQKLVFEVKDKNKNINGGRVLALMRVDE